jgi:nucleoside-diphosphate-sugar epimerase
MISDDFIIDRNSLILVTGANGFVGTRVVEMLLHYGFENLRCFVRPSSNVDRLNKIIRSFSNARLQVIQGNLLSRDDCNRAAEGVAVIYHLAAGIDKSFAGAFMNSVVTTRNLLDAILRGNSLKRFVNVSSFAVYSNIRKRRNSLLDETCEIEDQPLDRYEPYVFAKIKQDDLVKEYSNKYHIPYVIVRPSVVYGPGKKFIPARVGIDTFGIFLHLGGSIRIPLTYVDNCADAITLAGVKKGIDGEVFNIVDDDLPTSRQFLRAYKKNVRKFKSIYLPYQIFYVLCYLWEKYSKWSEGQLPPVFNRRRCATYWKGNCYSNDKLKKMVQWEPRVSFADALNRYFEYQKEVGGQ